VVLQVSAPDGPVKLIGCVGMVLAVSGVATCGGSAAGLGFERGCGGGVALGSVMRSGSYSTAHAEGNGNASVMSDPFAVIDSLIGDLGHLGHLGYLGRALDLCSFRPGEASPAASCEPATLAVLGSGLRSSQV